MIYNIRKRRLASHRLARAQALQRAIDQLDKQLHAAKPETEPGLLARLLRKPRKSGN